MHMPWGESYSLSFQSHVMDMRITDFFCGRRPSTNWHHSAPLGTTRHQQKQWSLSIDPFPQTPRRRPGLLHVRTRGDQHKAQEEIWLVSGLKHQKYLSVTKECSAKMTRG